MTRFRVPVGYEFDAETPEEAYQRAERYVTAYNEAAARRDSPLHLTIGHVADVLPLAGELTDAERARVAEASRPRG